MSKKTPEYIREPGGPERIDLRKMPPMAAQRLGRNLYDLAKEFFSDPENCRQRDAWLAQGGGDKK